MVWRNVAPSKLRAERPSCPQTRCCAEAQEAVHSEVGEAGCAIAPDRHKSSRIRTILRRLEHNQNMSSRLR